MQVTEKSKRKYFTKSQKQEILLQLNTGGMTHAELARQHNIHPVTIHKWKREMAINNDHFDGDVKDLLNQIKEIEKENELLKKALANMAIDKEILQTANEVLKKAQPKHPLMYPRK